MNAQLKRRAGTVLVAGAAAAATLATTSVSTTASAAAAAPCAPRSVAARTFALPASAVKLLSGDRNFASNGPAVTAWAELEKWTVGSPGNFHDELRVRFGMRADETKPNWTRAAGQTTALLWSAPRGCHIDASRLPGTFDSNGYLAQRPATPEPYSLAPGDGGINPSFVTRYRVYAQHSGNDVGTYTRVNVSTRSFRVYFTG